MTYEMIIKWLKYYISIFLYYLLLFWLFSMQEDWGIERLDQLRHVVWFSCLGSVSNYFILFNI